MPERSSVFDMIGPVMIGPSSSHTAGVVRIGRAARKLLCETPEQAEIIFYNSFARTYEGHGSDRAIVAGLLDFSTDDLRIKDAMSLAPKEGLSFSFKSVGNASTYHPNSIAIKLKGKTREREILGVSRGGGVINIEELNGFQANFSTTLHSLIIFADDIKGSIAFIADVVAHDDCNIATMSVSRKGKDDLACLVIEMDSGISTITNQYLKQLNWVQEVIYVPNITDKK